MMASSTTIRKLWPLALLMLVIFGGFLRFYRLSAQSYWMDEGYTVSASLSVQEHGSTILDSGQNYSCPLYCYPSAWIAERFGSNPASYRALAAVAGTLLIVATFFVGWEFFGQGAGLLVAAFTAFSYWQIAWSRQARWYTLFALFFWLAILFFWKALKNDTSARRIAFGCLAALFSLLAAIAHNLGYLLPGIFLAWIALDQIFIRKRFSWQRSLLAISFAAAALLALEGIFHLQFIRQVIAVSSISYELPYYLSFYLRNYWLFVALALATLYFPYRERKQEACFLLLVIGAYLIPLSFLTDVVQYRYLFQVTPALLLLGAAGALSLAEMAKRMSRSIIVIAAIFILFFAIGGGALLPRAEYFLESDAASALGSRPHYAYTPQPDWAGAYAFIAAHQQPGDAIVSAMPQLTKIYLGKPGYWIEYSYLGTSIAQPTIRDGKEYYANAQVLRGTQDLQALAAKQHGFLVFDYMAIDGRIATNTLAFIRDHFTQEYYEKTNEYSQVWVYRF